MFYNHLFSSLPLETFKDDILLRTTKRLLEISEEDCKYFLTN